MKQWKPICGVTTQKEPCFAAQNLSSRARPGLALQWLYNVKGLLSCMLCASHCSLAACCSLTISCSRSFSAPPEVSLCHRSSCYSALTHIPLLSYAYLIWLLFLHILTWQVMDQMEYASFVFKHISK